MYTSVFLLFERFSEILISISSIYREKSTNRLFFTALQIVFATAAELAKVIVVFHDLLQMRRVRWPLCETACTDKKTKHHRNSVLVMLGM